ncbi:MAG: GNAT family N-acetyltransferase [bacterium]|nr:GNAT family N-acetyltransferase [bacterium]
MITIRKYRKNDARTVAALISRTYSQFCRVEGTESAVQDYVDYYNPSGKTDDEIDSLYSKTPFRLVAVANQQIVGVLRAHKNRITNLFVDGDHHRQGIANRLVYRFEESCQAEGFTEIVLRGSLYAIPFYESLGYTKTADIQVFRGLKVQPMKKKLKKMNIKDKKRTHIKR